MGSTSKQKTPKRLPSFPSLSTPSTVIAHDLARKSGLQQQQCDLPSHLGDASCSCSETEARPDENSDNDSDVCDLALDGAMEDEILKGADALTKEEVVRRRARRVKQLLKLYKMQYWGLMDELRAKYRIFYLRNGKSGYRDEAEIAEKERNDTVDTPKQVGVDRGRGKLGDGGMKEINALDKTAIESIRCGFQGCKSKPLALSTFCFAHILSDPRQQLYRPCTYVIRSGQGGPLTCSKPVLRAVIPCFCPVHFQQAQKQAARSLKKGALGVSTASKPTLKLHLIIAEYVRLIQSKRRTASESVLKPVSGNTDKEAGNVCNAILPQEQVSQSTPQA